MKQRHVLRPLALLILALIAYGIGMLFGSGPGFAVFITGGGVLELMFWVALVRRVKNGTP